MSDGRARLVPVSVEKTGNLIKITFNHPVFGRGWFKVVRLPVSRPRPMPGDSFELPDGTVAIVESVEDTTQEPDLEIGE